MGIHLSASTNKVHSRGHDAINKICQIPSVSVGPEKLRVVGIVAVRNHVHSDRGSLPFISSFSLQSPL